MIVGYSLIVVFTGLLLIVAVAGFANIRFILRMKKHHYDIWQSLGSPSPVGNPAVWDGAPTLRYLRLRKYQALSDPETVRVASSTRLVNRISLIYIYVASVLLLGLVFFEKYVAK
jgi:hypothetical protein